MNQVFQSTDPASRGRLARVAVLALAAVVALLSLALVGLGNGAGADQTRAIKTVVLGQSATMPDPACPDNCQVVASVNGFQTRTATSTTPFEVPFDGKVTQFRLYLGEPTGRDRTALNDRFGSPPQAAITILKKVKTPQGNEKFQLLRKSPVEGLSKELGTVATFKLNKPLTARAGNYVALAVPTWAPVFALGQSAAQNKWRASRQPGMCTAASIDQSSPQLKVDTKRFYGCTFSGSRLLYTATLTNG